MFPLQKVTAPACPGGMASHPCLSTAFSEPLAWLREAPKLVSSTRDLKSHHWGTVKEKLHLILFQNFLKCSFSTVFLLCVIGSFKGFLHYLQNGKYLILMSLIEEILKIYFFYYEK